jgi:hypothetical protein
MFIGNDSKNKKYKYDKYLYIIYRPNNTLFCKQFIIITQKIFEINTKNINSVTSYQICT